jgi:hypothetical protein
MAGVPDRLSRAETQTLVSTTARSMGLPNLFSGRRDVGLDLSAGGAPAVWGLLEVEAPRTPSPPGHAEASDVGAAFGDGLFGKDHPAGPDLTKLLGGTQVAMWALAAAR